MIGWGLCIAEMAGWGLSIAEMAGWGLCAELFGHVAGASGNGISVVPLQVELDTVVVLLFLFGVGLLSIYHGYDEYRAGRLVRDTATETVRSAAVGRTELEGTATPRGTVLDRPFTEGDCLYASYQIREKREDDDGDTTWATLDHDTWVTDFSLDDGTGAILVDPDVSAKFEISDENSTTISVGKGRPEPPEVAEFLEHGTAVKPTSRYDRRYVEKVIPPGESVYVLGGAEIRADAEGRDEDQLVVRRDQGSDRFIVADMSEAELTTTLSRRAPILILLGLGMSAFSLYALLSLLGIG